MPLKTFVKASSITNLSDARYFAALEVDWMSYDCNPSSQKYVEPNKLVEMKNWLSGPKHCGECSNMDVEAVKAIVTQCELDGVEVDPFFKGKKKLSKSTTVFTRVLISKTTSFDELATIIQNSSTGTHHFILDLRVNEISFEDLQQGVPFKMEELSNLCQAASVLIDVELNGSEVEQFLANSKAKGLNLPGA